MSVFGNDIIQQSNPLESITTNMKINVENQLSVWNTDFWYYGIDHNSEYMKSTLEKQLCAYFEKDFDKIGLNVWKIVVYVYKKKYGFTGYDVDIDVNYYSPEFCGGLFSVTFDFKFKHPDCV